MAATDLVGLKALVAALAVVPVQELLGHEGDCADGREQAHRDARQNDPRKR
jgi:hypothetical protein